MVIIVVKVWKSMQKENKSEITQLAAALTYLLALIQCDSSLKNVALVENIARSYLLFRNFSFYAIKEIASCVSQSVTLAPGATFLTWFFLEYVYFNHVYINKRKSTTAIIWPTWMWQSFPQRINRDFHEIVMFVEIVQKTKLIIVKCRIKITKIKVELKCTISNSNRTYEIF